jgi:uncharacterized caspase-like protein
MTTNDARAFAEMLQTEFHFPKDAIDLMTDDPGMPEEKHPTVTRINRAIRNLLATTDETSEVVFYFSGHGVRQNDVDYMVPRDGDPDDIETQPGGAS